MKICSLSSGSKGNAIYLESNHTRLLIDAGVSGLQIQKRLESIDVDPGSLNAIVLTHAHRDHVYGSDVFSRKFQIPVWGHPVTLDVLTYMFKKNTRIRPWGGPFKINDLSFTPFRVSHDADPTVGYQISAGHQKIAICTDLGVCTNEVLHHIRGLDWLVIESNHDPDMLIEGPYPWELKERIASRVGHLSNHETGQLLKSIINGRMKKIFLAHLSEENNTAEIARHTVLDYIGMQAEPLIEVFEQRTVSPVFEI